MSSLRDRIRNALIKHSDRVAMYYLPYHFYLVHPSELAVLCTLLDETHNLSGPVVEIGCASGSSTVFLNKHMDVTGDRREYICIDTFSGFTDRDVEHEVEHRGKDRLFLKSQFRSANKELFKRTMEINAIDRVRIVQADVNEYAFDGINDISLCFIDVDLYLPVLNSLKKTLPRMAKGGIIAVHDCNVQYRHMGQDSPYDGAHEAYCEVIRQEKMPEQIVQRLGVIRT